MPTNGSPDDPALARARTIARWADNRLVDPLLGLVLPGAGDLVGAALGLYAVGLAWRRRAPKVLIARMLLNLAVDAAAGAVPILGDVYDFFFRAHRRNLDLLTARGETRAEEGAPRARKGDWVLVVGAALLFLAALALPVVLVVVAISALSN